MLEIIHFTHDGNTIVCFNAKRSGTRDQAQGMIYYMSNGKYSFVRNTPFLQSLTTTDGPVTQPPIINFGTPWSVLFLPMSSNPSILTILRKLYTEILILKGEIQQEFGNIVFRIFYCDFGSNDTMMSTHVQPYAFRILVSMFLKIYE